MSSWQHIQQRLQDGTASYFQASPGTEFALLGEPELLAGRFAVNVFNFGTSRVEVLTGDEALAARCVSAWLRHGALAVFSLDQTTGDLLCQGHLTSPLQLTQCDLTGLAKPETTP